MGLTLFGTIVCIRSAHGNACYSFYFFQKNIVHRDLKLGNIVLNRRYVLCNFKCKCKHFLKLLLSCNFGNLSCPNYYLSLFSCSTKKITITNFCLGKHLIREDDLLKDQRGSPAYISPDVLSGM